MNGILYGNINGNMYLWQNPIKFPLSKDQWQSMVNFSNGYFEYFLMGWKDEKNQPFGSW